MSDDIVERLRADFEHCKRMHLARPRFSMDEIGALFDEITRLRADAASWESQASDRVDDALRFAAERDAANVEISRLRAALAAAQPPAAMPVPPGMALVPVEATPAMCKAAVIFANGSAVYKNVTTEALKIEELIYGEAYAAMLAAAPAAQPVPATGAQSEPKDGTPHV